MIFKLFLSAVLIVTSSLVPPLCGLALIAFVPALWALEGTSIKRSIGGGALLFFLVALGAYYWIFVVSHYFGDLSLLPALLAVPVFGLLNIWQGLVGFALFAWCRDKIHRAPGLLFALCFSVAWHFIPAIFFWDLSLLVRNWLPFVQSLDFVGSFGLDFFILFFNCEIFVWLRTRHFSKTTAIAFALLTLNLGYGYFRLSQLEAAIAAAPTAKVAMIQPNIESKEKRDPQFVQQSLDTLLHLTETTV